MTPFARAKANKRWAAVAALGIMAIPRTNWTTAQLRELMELTATELTQ